MNLTLGRALCALFLGMTFMSRAQQDETNLDKYWTYRDRFRKNFIKVGSDQGESLPITTRRINWSHSQNQSNSALYWSDATIYLGHYLQVLATEHKLLSAAGQSTEGTESEIYYALRTIQRLDEKCEPYHENDLYGQTGFTNGLILRDDVQENFKNYFVNDYSLIFNTECNFQFTHSDYNPLHIWSGENTPGTYAGYNDKNIQSLDQLLDLFTGLYVVWKLVPDMVIQPTAGDPVMQLHNYIATTAGRFYARLENDNFMIKKFNSTDNVPRGANCWPEADMFRKITMEMFGGTISYAGFLQELYGISQIEALNLAEDGGISLIGIDGVNTTTHQEIEGLWHVIDYTNIPISDNGLCFSLSLGGNICFFDGPLNDDNIHIILQTATLANYWGHDYLQMNSNAPENAFYWYPLLSSVLYHNNSPMDMDQEFYRNFLSSAPCEGPWADPNNVYSSAPNGWASQSLLFHPSNALNGPADPSFRGEYSGLDYMLYHNLYRLIWGNTEEFKPLQQCACVQEITSSDEITNPITVSRKFGTYQEMQIPIPSFLSHNVTANGVNAQIHVKNDLTICSPIAEESVEFHLSNGAQLMVYEGNTFTVKKGNKLIVESGAILSGAADSENPNQNSPQIILEENAELIVMPGGTLNMNFGLDISAHANSKITLSGATVLVTSNDGMHTILLENEAELIATETTFNKPSGPNALTVEAFSNASVTLTECVINMHQSNWAIHQNSILNCTNSTVDLENSNLLGGNTSSVDFNNSSVALSNTDIDVTNGSVLTIQNTSIALVDESTVELKKTYEGAETPVLSYNSSDITLQGYGSRIALLGGEIIIGEESTFAPEHSFGPAGYIEVGPEPENKIILNTNALLNLTGDDSDNLILKVHDHKSLSIEGENGSVEFAHGRIELGSNSKVLTEQNALFSFTNVYGSSDGGNEIQNTNASIRSNHCTLEQVSYIGNGSNMDISHDDFIGENAGVENKFGQYKIAFCNFTDCGVESTSLHEASSIANCNFIGNISGNTSGVFDKSIVEIVMQKNSLIGYSKGISKIGGKLTLRCNSLTDNTTAIIASKTILNMSSLSSGGYNVFDHNTSNILLNNCLQFDMNRGYNSLVGWVNSNITGTILGSCDPFTCEGASVIAHANHWENSPSNGVAIFTSEGAISCAGIMNGCPIDLIDDQPQQTTACPIVRPFVKPSVRELVVSNETNSTQRIQNLPGQLRSEIEELPLIFSEHFDGVPLDSALGLASWQMELYDSLANDLLALQLFHEVLSTPLDKSNLDIRYFIHWGVENMKSTLENLFATNELIAENNQSTFDPYVQQYVDVINGLTTSNVSDSIYTTQFYLELNKGQLFSTLKKPEMASWIFTHLDDCALDSLEQETLNRWIYEVELEIQNQNADGVSSFEMDTTSFNTPEVNDFDHYRFGVTIHSPNSVSFVNCQQLYFYRNLTENNVEISIYPNPASEKIFVNTNADLNIQEIVLLDVQGRDVKRWNSADAQLMPSGLDLPQNLESGSYILQLLTPEEMMQFKLMIQ
jgi:hypothetical protein